MASKIFWLLVAAVLVVVLVPPVRAKVWPKLQPALNPVYEWSARSQVNELRGVVKRADAIGRAVPTGDAFSRFVENESMEENASIDPWGNAYYIVVSGQNFQVGSAGKDRVAGTQDDILSRPEPLSHPPAGRRF